MTIDSTTKVYLNGVEQVKIIKNGSVIWEKQQDNTDYFYIENTYQGENTLTLATTQTGSPTAGSYTTSVQYSKDKSTWMTMTLTAGSSNSITLNQGEKVYFRNNNGVFNYTDDSKAFYTTIIGSETHNVGGNINTLLDYEHLDNITLPQGCFNRMFVQDTTLVDASNLSLPSTTLSPHCYRALLNGCISLTTAPVLPATTLAKKCYYAMFYGDISLTVAPALPATTLANNCYDSMLRGTGITTSPVLPATTLTTGCYLRMLQDCTSLNSVTTYANNISASNCINNWLNNVAASGTFNNLGSATYTTSSASGIPAGWTEVKPQPVIDYFYIQNVGDFDSYVFVKNEGNGDDTSKYTDTLEYSKDKVNWTTIQLEYGNYTFIPDFNIGDKIYFRNDKGVLSYYDESIFDGMYVNFDSEINFKVGGDLRTLLDYTDIQNVTLSPGSFYNLFSGSRYIVDASDLDFSGCVAQPYCFRGMFYDSSIVTPPVSLTTTTANYCCYGMFQNCINLTTSPVLPATTLAEGCYSIMFSQSGITTVPSLPATTLALNCYSSMFSWCDGITTVPYNLLPATTLSRSCYQNMFNNCKNLTNSPNLPATTLERSCYQNMFGSCLKLTTVGSISATTTGQLSCSSMFYKCNSLTTAPSLPATNLGVSCYQNMFQNCINLTTSPVLPATTLANYCYNGMFSGCTSLNSVTTYANDISATNCTNNWLNGVSSSGDFYNLGSATYPSGVSGIPTGWTVHTSL